MTGCSIQRLLIIVLLGMLAACQHTREKQAEQPADNDSFSISYIAKTDINMIFDRQMKTIEDYLQDLMLKLYLRNPTYWREAGAASAEQRTQHIFSLSDMRVSMSLHNTRSIATIQLAFDENFSGDRVLAFVFGLKTMLHDAHGGKSEFFMLDQLDPQKLYDAARNIEVAVWKLSNDRMQNGQLFLVSNELDGEIKNLSFERLFGQLIAIQDNSAVIVADSTNRVIKHVIQSFASYVFLPI